jgi:hypothetical protein
MATIQNLETEVIWRVENRVTETSRADVWIRDTLIEIAGNPDYRDSFPELEVTGPTFNLTGGSLGTSVQEYAETNFLSVGDYNIKSLEFFIWTDFSTNQQRKKLRPTAYQEADEYTSGPSLPTQWYRYGLNIGFDPTPNQNYQVQARVMRRHPITDYFNTSGLLNTTTILLPTEWFEVIEWAAAMRGFMELLNFERAGEIRTMLFGDPAHPNDNPGLIASVKTKRAAERWVEQQPLRPIIKGSCWGSS